MKNLCLKIKKEMNDALEGLREVPFNILSNRHICLKQNISTLKSPGIIIVSLSEYRKLAFAELVLREAIKRGYGLQMPKKTKPASAGSLPDGPGSGGSCQSRQGRRLFLVHSR